MEENKTVQVIVSVKNGLVDDVQVFRSETTAQQMWDASIEEAKKSVKYDNLSPEEQKKFDQDPFGFAYDGDIDLIWEETTLKDYGNTKGNPMNPKCPQCGEESLRATVTVTYTNVPLGTDGYSCMDGTIAHDEIDGITCMNCKKEVPVEHYYEEKADEPSNQTRTDPLPF